jgi:hypothetical protein
MMPSLYGHVPGIDLHAALAESASKQQKWNEQEKRRVVEALTEAIAQKPDAAYVDVQALFVARVSGSALDALHAPARRALLALIDEQGIRKQNALAADTLIGVDPNARLFAVIDGYQWPLSTAFVGSALDENELGTLAACAALTGGYVFSAEVIGVEQWLRFEQFIVPTSVADTKNLIAFVQFKLPASPPLGDYHELLRAPVSSPFHLSQADRSIIREMCAQSASANASLFQFLNIKNFNLIPPNDRRRHAASLLHALLNRPRARALGKALHERLEWHLETDDSATSERQLKLMIAAALIISLSPAQEPDAGYDVYRPETAQWTAQQVQEDLERYLVDNGRVDADHAPLAAYLLLCGNAPECVVKETPAGLSLEKPLWVVLSQAVTLIELAAPGASSMMTHAQIMAFSQLSPVTIELQQLHELTAVMPIVHWAVMNRVIPYRAEKDYDKDTLLSATAYFTRYIKVLHQLENGLTTAPPDRRKLGVAELTKVLPKGPYLEQKAFSFNYQGSIRERNWLDALNFVNPAGIVIEAYDYLVSETGADEIQLSKLLRLRFSMLDLYLSGDLLEDGRLSSRFKTRDNFNPPAGAFANLSELPALDTLYEAAFERYYQQVQESLTSVIKMTIASLPEPDRDVLNHGSLSLYTVRQEVSNFTPGFETQMQRDEMKGRYGLIVCSSNGNEHRCYELFTLRGVCRERPAFVGMLQSSGIIDDVPSLSYVGGNTAFQPKNRWRLWPLDFAAYREGSEPRNGEVSRVVVEKLWQIAVQAEDIQPVALFFSAQLHRFADFIITHHPVAPRQALYDAVTPRTELEQWRLGKDAVQNAFIDLVVPFKRCVEDIKTGNAPRVVEGIGGCILDGLAVLGLLIGLGATVVSVIVKSASTTAKMLSIAKAGGRVVAALANPVDGVPTLVWKGLRKVPRGLLLLSDGAVSAAHTATGQLRKLTGTQRAQDLIEAGRLPGHWRAPGKRAEAVNLAVLQEDAHWYAMSELANGSWNWRVKYHQLMIAPPARWFFKVKDFGFTRFYVKKALRIARLKLDNAISQFIGSPAELVRDVVKYVFGSDSTAALKLVFENLSAMRKDLDSLTLANVAFKQGDNGVLAALRPAAYKRWKNGIETGVEREGEASKFLDIYPEQLDDYYRVLNYDNPGDALLSDVLIHEMAHGAPQALDLYHTRALVDRSPAEFDVTGLIELARNADKAHPDTLLNPNVRMAHREGFREFEGALSSRLPIIRSHPALANAQSYALAVSLLSQRKTHAVEFYQNIYEIERALDITDDDQFIQYTISLVLA